jgi:hypothetical protein
MVCDLTAKPDDALASVLQGHLGFDVVHPDISPVAGEQVHYPWGLESYSRTTFRWICWAASPQPEVQY